MKVVTLNPLWQALLVTPSILGLTLGFSPAASLAQNRQSPNPSLAVDPSIKGSASSPILSASTAASQEQAVRSTADNQLIAETSVNPLVSAEVIPPVPGAPTNPARNLTSLQTPAASIGQPRFAQTQIGAAPNNEAISDIAANAPIMLVQSTDSRDLQTTGAPSPKKKLSLPLLAQSSDVPETPFPPDSTEAPATNSTETQPIDTKPENEKWHFLFAPYIYVPLSISGDAGFRTFRGRDVSTDFDFTPNQITTALRNSLDFAFFGTLEAWTPSYKLGILTNVDYLSLSTESTFTRPLRRPGLANFVPTELNAAVNSQALSVDLAATYRFYDPAKVNPEGVATEFDLGPVLFDVIGGMNILSINSEIDLTTNLGGDVGFDGGRTVVSPLLGGRFRWNTSPKLAVVVAGSVSGFGISGLSQYSFRTGIDWMFSGNTSLGVGYRFGFLNYNSSNRRDFSLETNQNGPYISFGFRF